MNRTRASDGRSEPDITGPAGLEAVRDIAEKYFGVSQLRCGGAGSIFGSDDLAGCVLYAVLYALALSDSLYKGLIGKGPVPTSEEQAKIADRYIRHFIPKNGQRRDEGRQEPMRCSKARLERAIRLIGRATSPDYYRSDLCRAWSEFVALVLHRVTSKARVRHRHSTCGGGEAGAPTDGPRRRARGIIHLGDAAVMLPAARAIDPSSEIDLEDFLGSKLTVLERAIIVQKYTAGRTTDAELAGRVFLDDRGRPFSPTERQVRRIRERAERVIEECLGGEFHPGADRPEE